MQSKHKKFGPCSWGLVLSLSVLFSASIEAADEPMKLACKYDSAKMSDTAEEKGYLIDCKISTDMCPVQHFVLDARWKVQGDNSVLNTTVTSGLGETSTQTITVDRPALRFAFRWEMPSKKQPPPILTGEGGCVVEK